MSNTDHNKNLIDYAGSYSHMASLEVLLKSHSLRKATVSKSRKQVEAKLKEAVSKKRRSSSGLVALDKKKEDLTRAKDHAMQLLNQHLSQKASIERLKIAAEERLKQEQDANDSASQESQYGSSEDKGVLAERLQYINEKIAELHSELKERESTYSRLEKEIQSGEKTKSKIEDQLKKQVHARPSLLEQLKVSTKEELHLRPKFESLLKLEEQASKALSVVQKKLAEIAAQKRKRMAILAAQKRKRMAALATQKRKRAAALAARKRKARKMIKTRKAKRKSTRKKVASKKKHGTKTSKKKTGSKRKPVRLAKKKSKKPRRR